MGRPESHCASGSANASMWLADHGDVLFAHALARVRRTDIAEDLVQETLLAAIARSHSFSGRSSARTWLVSILKHKIADHFRREARREPTAASPARDVLARWIEQQFQQSGKWKQPPGNWGDSASILLGDEEFRATLQRCLHALPPQSAQMIRLVEGQGLSAEHAGKVLNLSTTNVGVMLFRARTALRHCLEMHWFDSKPSR